MSPSTVCVLTASSQYFLVSCRHILPFTVRSRIHSIARFQLILDYSTTWMVAHNSYFTNWYASWTDENSPTAFLPPYNIVVFTGLDEVIIGLLAQRGLRPRQFRNLLENASQLEANCFLNATMAFGFEGNTLWNSLHRSHRGNKGLPSRTTNVVHRLRFDNCRNWGRTSEVKLHQPRAIAGGISCMLERLPE